MEKLSIVVVENEGGMLTGWVKDNPSVVAEGSTYAELVQNIMEAVKIFSEVVNK